MTNLERMREAAKNKPPAAPPKPKITPPQGGSGTAPPQGKKPPKPSNPVVEPKEKVTFQCGHQYTPKGITSIDCPHCRDVKRRGAAKKWQAKMLLRKQTKLTTETGEPVVFRLPKGSVKTLKWDGDKWHGSALITGAGPAFTATASTELECLRALHRRYIEWLASQQPPPESKPEVADAPQG